MNSKPTYQSTGLQKPIIKDRNRKWIESYTLKSFNNSRGGFAISRPATNSKQANHGAGLPNPIIKDEN